MSIGGQAAYVDFVSPGQVNALVPSNVAPGSQPLTVTTTGGSTFGYVITVNPTQPEVYAPAFNINGNRYARGVAFRRCHLRSAARHDSWRDLQAG